MTDKNKRLIAVVLDRSGSMSSIRADMQGGFNSFMAAQRQEPGECLVSLYQFDDHYEQVYEDLPAASVPPLVIEPRGSTALLDALHRAMSRVGQRLSEVPEAERPGAVIFMIITDGHENASREVSRANVRAFIERQHTQYQWQFVYLGADAGAFHEAASIGIRAAGQYTASPKGVNNMWVGTASVVQSYSSSVRSGASGQSMNAPQIDLDDKISINTNANPNDGNSQP